MARTIIVARRCYLGGSLCFVAWCVLVSVAFAEVPCLADFESPNSEGRLTPLHIKMSGFVNTRPEDGSIGLIKLEIRSYRVSAYFEVVTAEAIDCPQATKGVLLQQIRKRGHFPLIGANDLLIKVATAAPGTPLTLDGYYRPRHRKLHLQSVEVIGMTN